MRNFISPKKSTESIFSKLFETLLQAVYPPKCLHCEEPLFGEYPAMLCQYCYDNIVWHENNSCTFCGAATGEHAKLGKGCSSCKKHKQAFTRAVGVVRYNKESKALVHALKFHGNRRLASPLGSMMFARLVETEMPQQFNSIIPVPLHKKRLRMRGYNQSALLAEIIAKKLKIKPDYKSLLRVRHTEAQSSLSYALRMENPRGAFSTTRDFTGQSVLLVDDVLTTGATVNACAECLRECGAKHIYAIVFAR